MCSYAGELYCKTMLDHLGLDNERGLYPELNGNAPTNEFINSRRTKSIWSPADTDGGKYILDDGYNGNDDRNDVITDDDLAYFMNDVNDAIDAEDNVLLQNWTIEDLESLWMSADLLTDDAKNSASESSFPVAPRDNDVIDEMKSCAAVAFLSPISGIETDSLADDQSATSGTSGRLSRQSSFSSSGRSSVSSSVAGSGFFRFDDPLGTCRSTVKSVTRRSSSGKVSKTSRGRNNSLGSSADWRSPTGSSIRPGERDWTSCTTRNGGLRKTLPEVKYLTRQASLESATRRSSRGGGEGRSVNYVDGDVDDDDEEVASSEFVRLLLQTRNSNTNNNLLTNEADDCSSINGDRLAVHRSRLQQRRRRQPRRRSTVDGFGDSSERGPNNCHVRSCPTSPEVLPTSHALLDDFSRQTSLNGHSNIDVTSCDRRVGYAHLSPFPVSRLAKSTSREIIQQAPEMKWSQSWQPLLYGQGSSPPSQKTPAAVGCRHGNQRRRLLEDHCYSREVVCSERNPSSIGKCSSTVAVRKSNVVSAQINHDGTSSNLASNQQMTDVVCGSVLELLLRSSGSFPANHGSDALIVEEQLGRCRYSSSRRASTVCIESIDNDDFDSKSDETVDALNTASDGGPPRGSTLLHRLLTEDSGARTDFQRMSDEKTSLRASKSASESTLQAHSIGEIRDAVRATGNPVSPAACTIRASSSDSDVITSGDGGQSTSCNGNESNCWPFGPFKWDDDSSSSCSRLTMLTTGDQENPAVDRSRHCWKSSTNDEMAPIEDNEQWMAQYFGHVFQL